MTVIDVQQPAAASAPSGETSTAADTSDPIKSWMDAVVGTGDHKALGRLMIGASLLHVAVFSVIGLLGMIHTASDGSFLAGDVAERFGLNMSFGLVLCGLMPLALGLALYVVPLQVGASAVAFPRAAAAATWGWFLSAALFLVAVLADGSYGGGHVKMARLGNVAVGAMSVALLIGGMCVAVTVLSLRPKGMGLDRVPHFSFAMLVTGSLWMFTLPAVVAHVVLLQISQANEFTIALAGTERFGFLFRQPSVYLLVIPMLGIALDVTAALTGQRTRLPGLSQALLGLAGLVAFGTWAQIPPSRSTVVWVGFALLGAVPVLGVLGNVADAIRRGTPKVASPLAFVVLSLVLLLVGSAAGVLGGIETAGQGDLFGLGPSLPLAQMLLVAGAALTGLLGGCFYWGTKVWGGALPDGPGKGLAPVVWLGGLLAGGGQLALAIAAAAADDPPDPAPFAVISAVGLALLALAALATVGASVLSMSREGGDAFADPWGGMTLEWASPSPPPLENFPEPLPPIESAEPLADLADARGDS